MNPCLLAKEITNLIYIAWWRSPTSKCDCVISITSLLFERNANFVFWGEYRFGERGPGRARRPKTPKLENEDPLTRKWRPQTRKRRPPNSKTKISKHENEDPETRKRRPLTRKSRPPNSKIKTPELENEDSETLKRTPQNSKTKTPKLENEDPKRENEDPKTRKLAKTPELDLRFRVFEVFVSSQPVLYLFFFFLIIVGMVSKKSLCMNPMQNSHPFSRVNYIMSH